MAKRTKKPPVKPEKRLEWLHRIEKDGETLTHIADADNFDLRTVRKHIEIARLERDIQKARSEVLREALEGHYRDLLDTVRNIEKRIYGQSQVSLEKDVPLMMGLRQHMPRSPLWENLRKWNRSLTELTELEVGIRNNLQQDIKKDGRLSGIISQGVNGIIPAVVDVLVHQMKEWASGRNGLKIGQDIHVEKALQGMVIMRYGFSSFGEIEERNVEIIKDVLVEFEAMIKRSLKLVEMEKLIDRLGRLKKSINDVITTVLLRRIVPGRCKYCPI